MPLSRVALLTVVAVGLSGLTACSSSSPAPSAEPPPATSSAPAPPPTGPPFHDAENGFTLIPPAGWERRPDGANVSATFRSTEADTAATGPLYPIVLVVAVGTPLPLSAFATGTEKEEGSGVAGFRVVSNEPITLADGRTGRIVNNTQPDSDVGQLHGTELFVKEHGRVYLVSITTSEPGLANYRATIDQMFQTFHVD